jgi:hypothetical protein
LLYSALGYRRKATPFLLFFWVLFNRCFSDRFCKALPRDEGMDDRLLASLDIQAGKKSPWLVWNTADPKTRAALPSYAQVLLERCSEFDPKQHPSF